MRLSLIAPYLLLASVTVLYINERSRRTALDAVVADLQEAQGAPVVSQEGTPLSEATPVATPTVTTIKEETPVQESRPPTHSTQADERTASSVWRADQQLRRISRFISLSPVQKEQLRGALARQQEAHYSEEPRLEGEVRTLLGDELVNQYEELSTLEEREEERQRLEREAIILGRQLDLNREQESKVASLLRERADALSGTRVEIQNRSSQLMTKHFETNSSKEDLRSGYEELRDLQGELKEKERTYLSERLKGVLTPEQYEKWMALEASRGEGE